MDCLDCLNCRKYLDFRDLSAEGRAFGAFLWAVGQDARRVCLVQSRAQLPDPPDPPEPPYHSLRALYALRALHQTLPNGVCCSYATICVAAVHIYALCALHQIIYALQCISIPAWGSACLSAAAQSDTA